jgi:hypothetical protein
VPPKIAIPADKRIVYKFIGSFREQDRMRGSDFAELRAFGTIVLRPLRAPPSINPAADARQPPDRRPPAVRPGTAIKRGGRQLQPIVRPHGRSFAYFRT